MTSKEQERKALAQIRKIVDGLGEDSYLSFAFDGCFEMAEENIEMDFGNSPRDKIEYLSEMNERIEENNAALSKEKEMTLKELALAKETIRQEADRADGFVKRYNDLSEKYREQESKLREAEAALAQYELENMKLKARLYDLLTAENK